MYNKLLKSRLKVIDRDFKVKNKIEAEGGCGVIGLASSEQLEGRYLYQALYQMKNRGNRKGGGIAAVGLSNIQLGVSKKMLNDCYIFQLAILNENYKDEIEKEYISEFFEVYDSYKIEHLDHQKLGLEVRPPEIYRYFIKIREDKLKKFIRENELEDIPEDKVEEEMIWQISFMLNKKYYSSLGDKRAMVMSSGKNMIVLKLVGYGDEVIKYYKLDDFKAHVWIGHHRYPTKGKVWHPGGAHPFVGVNHALVHNGDFSNYHPIVEYLKERNYEPLFLTDTEVAILVFDLLYRVYEYPLEYLIEALAPTLERDFYKLPLEKRKIYREIQALHMTSSPDGPWFFIIAGHDPRLKQFQLIGITDTSMLRPQVFSYLDSNVKLGIVASERQAINAILRDLYEDTRIPSLFADKYWVARGGSHTDGGAFIYVYDYEKNKFECFNKFGIKIKIPEYQEHYYLKLSNNQKIFNIKYDKNFDIETYIKIIKDIGWEELLSYIESIKKRKPREAIELLTRLYDLPYNTGMKRRSSIKTILLKSLYEIFDKYLDQEYKLIDFYEKDKLHEAKNSIQTLVIDSKYFPSEGEDSLSRFVVEAYKMGWRKIIVYNMRGQRFLGCGLGPNSDSLRIDVYGDSGDYLGSGLDGAEIYVHGSAQDQVAQIMKRGKIVIYGDVGQTFMYSSKGGEVYVLGSAAGRPLINSVGKPRVVINGTCLDYLAESFMAGDPLKGGGFVILNGIGISDEGEYYNLEDPYPGGNLFSLASGGAIYIRDPYNKLEENQLHGGKYVMLTKDDWDLILPYLKNNEKLFNITLEFLLTIDGEKKSYNEIYKKVIPTK